MLSWVESEHTGAIVERRPSWWLALILVAFGAVYGLGSAVNGTAFLLHIGEERDVHIERIKIEYVSMTDPDGNPTIVDARVGVGWYEDDGRRHTTELTGFGGEVGDVVHTRAPLLPEWLGFQSHRIFQAVLSLFLAFLGLAASIVFFIYLDQ